jgi:hypothetical protein
VKKAKSQVDYSKGMKKSHCGPLNLYDKGYCKHFIEPGSCRLVSGKIEKAMWCKLFSKAK